MKSINDPKPEEWDEAFSQRADKKDMVNKPEHYQGNTIEVIDAIDNFCCPKYGYEHGNAIKYLLRWHKKGGVEDLKKCKWYIDRIISKETK